MSPQALILPGSSEFDSTLRRLSPGQPVATTGILISQGYTSDSARAIASAVCDSTEPRISLNRQAEDIHPIQLGTCKFFTGFHIDQVKGLQKLHEFDKNDSTTLHAFNTRKFLNFTPTKGAFVYAYEDSKIQTDKGTYPLKAGMHASLNSSSKILGKGIILENHRYRPIFRLGGPLEEQGRLKYIDGCTSTEMIKPEKLGDPCLNHLHFPKAIDQTMHTHPSIRVGMIAKGHGTCVVPGREIPLTPGTVFIIHKQEDLYEKIGDKLVQEGSHKFRTDTEGMEVVAYHPDSTTGPTDESHQMLNNTMVNGVAARDIAEIRTQ